MTIINSNGLLHSECIQPDNEAKSQIPARGEELPNPLIYLFYEHLFVLWKTWIF